MRYLLNMPLHYVEPGDGNLYDDIDLFAEDCVDALYWKENGYPGNPDICALPRAATMEEMACQNNIPVAGYDPANVRKLPLYERKRKLAELKRIRYPFPFHATIEYNLSMTLIASYGSRKNGLTKMLRGTKASREDAKTGIVSCMEGIQANVPGFSIVGSSGTGKSTAFDLTCMKYPKVIRHVFDEGQYFQIPIIRLTAFANSNLTALFISFARQLDRLLDTGEDHLAMVQGKTNLGKIVSIVCNWIEVYHIGVITIDEIQFLDFDKNSSKSFENFLTITANTGVAIVTIGTPEACQAWGGMLRIQRRIAATVIRSDEYCKDEKFVDAIIRRIWKYQWMDEPVRLTQELSDAMYEESGGSIDLLTSLWMMVQFEALNSRKSVTVDAEFIRKVSEKHIRRMRELLEKSMVESETQFLKLRQNLTEDIRKSAEAEEERRAEELIRLEAEENIRSRYDHDLVLSQVMASISDCYPEYSDLQIRRAFARAEKQDGFKSAGKGKRVQEVLSLLKKAKGRTKAAADITKKSESANAAEKTGRTVNEQAKSLEESILSSIAN